MQETAFIAWWVKYLDDRAYETTLYKDSTSSLY